MKRFIYASLFYLVLTALFGVLDGAFDLGYIAVYAHTHFSLLGFMSMMIFGIGYFILPRFSGSELRFPGWVAVHFWLANTSLMAMVAFRGLSVETGSDVFYALFVVSAGAQVVSLLMFVINVWISLTPAGQSTAPANQAAVAPADSQHGPSKPVSSKSRQAITVSGQTRVGDLVDFLPSLQDTLIACGLRPLQMPGHLEHVRAAGVTLATAAQNHGLELDSVIKEIVDEINGQGLQVNTEPSAKGSLGDVAPATLIGEVIRQFPDSHPVFQKYFGSGCFDCPGQAFESIDMACRMHGVNTQTFLRELRQTKT